MNDIKRLYVEKKGWGTGLLQNQATYKAQIINIAEYLNTKYVEDQFVNIIESQESNQPHTNSTIKIAEKFAEQLNQSNENSDTKMKAFNT